MPKNTFEDRDLTKITEVEEFKEVVNCFRRAYALLPLKDATNFLDLLISKSLEFDDYRSLITLYYSPITKRREKDWDQYLQLDSFSSLSSKNIWRK